MRKKLIAALLFITMAFSLVACGKLTKISNESEPTSTDVEANTPSDDETISQNKDEKTFDASNSTNMIYTDMIDYLYNTRTGSNVIISPTSYNIALGMLEEGASGETLDAMEHYFGKYVYAHSQKYEAMMEKLEENEDSTITLANAIFVDNKYEVLDSYKETIGQKFRAEPFNIDFDDDSAVEFINNWCDTKTNHLINSILNPGDIDSSTPVVLTNALYFKDNWFVTIDDSQVFDEEFTNVDGSIKTVDGLHVSGLNWYGTDQAKAFMNYYENNDVAFVGILPDESIIDKNGDFNLADIDIDELLDSKKSNEANVMFPAFKIEDSNPLSDVMIDRGLGILFTDDADFSLMGENICVGDVIQKTVVDVNQQGTEAAAVTAITMQKCSAPIEAPEEIYLNRPFAFMIYDVDNDEILFLGKIVKL